MIDRLDRIGVFMIVDPVLGISLEQAKRTLDAVLEFNDDGLPLTRAGLTGQHSTTTQWPALLEYTHYAAMECNQGSAVRIYGDLQGMTKELAREIYEMGALLYGEWFGPTLDEAAIQTTVSLGKTSKEEAEAMLLGIKHALAVNALTGIEFQVNRWNIEYVEPFIWLCKGLGIEAHLEMQEMQFSRGDDFSNLRQRYLTSLPSKEQLRQIARAVASFTREPFEEPLSPFFCRGNCGVQYGVCNYWFENGLFVWPNGEGGLIRTACLSDKTIIDPDFHSSVECLKKHLNHALVKMRKVLQQKDMTGTKCAKCKLWSACRGGCRAMAFLASGHDFAPDPNCWYWE